MPNILNKRNFLLSMVFAVPVLFSFGQDTNSLIYNRVAELIPGAEILYRELHQTPELSLQEIRTSAKMAEALKKLGFEVTTNVGGNGVVGVFRNGKGPVLMLRTDMDALPVEETTGITWASRVKVTDSRGSETPVMHACGHDLHMTVWSGTLSTLVSLKKEWKGTIVAVAQPAEEMSKGSEEMIRDGLFSRFPKPDYALCFHVTPDLPAGTVGYCPGPIMAGVNSVDIKVTGVGGHGAMPHRTIDPVVLSARIILDYQTIVSREINPVSPAVVTVGSIHGGTKHNIIPSEVNMQLTIRFFTEDVYKQIVAALERISRGVALSAGLSEDQMPYIRIGDEFTPPVDNDPVLVNTVVTSMKNILGESNLIKVDPSTTAEDFGKYGRTSEKVKISLFWLGVANQGRYSESLQNNTIIPSLHNGSFLPDFEPSYRTGVTAMTKAAIDILQQK